MCATAQITREKSAVVCDQWKNTHCMLKDDFALSGSLDCLPAREMRILFEKELNPAICSRFSLAGSETI